MPFLSHRATFKPGADASSIVSDLCCRNCGNYDPGEAVLRAEDGQLQILCVECVTFNTIEVSPGQLSTLLALLHPAEFPTQAAALATSEVHVPRMSEVGITSETPYAA